MPPLALLLAVAAAGSPLADQAVLAVLDPAPEATLSSLLDEASAWLRDRTALTLVAGDQVGLDREAVGACPADALYSCLARALAALPARPRVGILVARARASDVQLLVLDLVELGAHLDAEEHVYARVRRVSGPTASEALERLASLPAFEPPARARVEAEGCDGCLVRVGPADAVLSRAADELRLRAGPARVEVLREGRAISGADVTLVAGRTTVLRLVVPPAPPAWRPAVSLGVAAAGAGAIAAGIAVAVARDARLCATAGAPCGDGSSADPRVAAYDADGARARVLVVAGAVGLLGGLVAWGLDALADDAPTLSVE